ncbi:MAG: hypothetical protein ACK42C_00050 [Aquificaceae bacterium]
MSLELEFLENYEKSLKEGTSRLFEVPSKEPVETGQIRELWCVPVERFLILSEDTTGLYITVPLTSYIQLLPRDTLFFELKGQGLLLGVVPVWDYLRQEVIENYSKVIGKVSEDDLKKVKELLKTGFKDKRWAVKRFLRLNSKRWVALTMGSLLVQAELAEEEQ